MEDDDEHPILTALQDITQTDRAFFSMVRFLDGGSRTHIIAAYLRNSSQALGIIRTVADILRADPSRERVVMNIPLTTLMDPSGTFMRTFFEPVPVVPTPEQIAAATETHIGVTDTTCTVCQESVECATRLRACGHCFHAHCIAEWLTMNTRCPVCRNDVRNLQTTAGSPTNDRRLHPDEE